MRSAAFFANYLPPSDRFHALISKRPTRLPVRAVKRARITSSMSSFAGGVQALLFGCFVNDHAVFHRSRSFEHSEGHSPNRCCRSSQVKGRTPGSSDKRFTCPANGGTGAAHP